MSATPKNVFLEQYKHDVHFSKTMLRVIIILMKRMGVQEIGLKPEEFLYLHDNAGISRLVSNSISRRGNNLSELRIPKTQKGRDDGEID